MKKSDFFFELPESLIAQTPPASRGDSRLLCLNRSTGAIDHRHFSELPALLNKGDCLVLNDSRVLPARLCGTTAAGAGVEVLLLKEVSGTHTQPYPQPSKFSISVWECLVRPGKRAKTGAQLTFGQGELTASVNEVLENGNRIIEFRAERSFPEMLEKLGRMPVPPYIHEELQDPERYQTVYARIPGSAAAPTAGLHFTNELLGELKARGVKVCYVTLHVGPGTFRPVKTETVEDHVMHSETYTLPRQTAEIISTAKADGGRIIAVGTTSCRVLETACDEDGTVSPCGGDTDIFIYPGYNFKCIDGLITNFHLPGSTLIMLVSALAGRGRILGAYNEAKEKKYRFFSFGDAMFII